jgi:hypothetical protein
VAAQLTSQVAIAPALQQQLLQQTSGQFQRVGSFAIGLCHPHRSLSAKIGHLTERGIPQMADAPG